MDGRDSHGLPNWAAADRNKQPILEVLLSIVPSGHGTFLEISAATGQHAAHFAPHFPGYNYYVSDCDETHLVTLHKRLLGSTIGNLLGPLRLDTTSETWPIPFADIIYNANMMHIAPWSASVGLFRGAARTLTERGQLLTYGPYRIDGQHTSESNERFDSSLRERDPDWGVRDLSALNSLAESVGLRLTGRTAMPANNFLLAWGRSGSGD
jgi:hypothetical protein